jgi:hypothetical protein
MPGRLTPDSQLTGSQHAGNGEGAISLKLDSGTGKHGIAVLNISYFLVVRIRARADIKFRLQIVEILDHLHAKGIAVRARSFDVA